ncbi:MAG TPA: hypothetical protein VGR27_00630 [Longimicrobiaceae bacterium]|nr:hypothetical protein [Longimicrobiaceae bacterium]
MGPTFIKLGNGGGLSRAGAPGGAARRPPRSSLLEMNELMQTLPGRVNQVLDNVASDKLEVR